MSLKPYILLKRNIMTLAGGQETHNEEGLAVKTVLSAFYFLHGANISLHY